ncbi:STAS domain-containing protein [Mycobacterium interjectum]|uniref:STAS domain-containing protein n=1 Tax=Mycobacterium interjectum TaxID=33895 RepID=UPI000A04BA50|nr:STAS domain-containing protein [Mycobacterium interjectum]
MTSSPEGRPGGCGEPRSRYVIDCAGAQVRVHARSLATVLSIDGDIDASNADLIAEVVRRFARLKAPLVVDVSRVDFLSSAGLRVLLLLNEEHREAQLHNNVVNGAALRRLTRIVTDHGLPVVDSVPEALQNTHEFIHARRRLLAALTRQGEPQRNAP